MQTIKIQLHTVVKCGLEYYQVHVAGVLVTECWSRQKAEHVYCAECRKFGVKPVLKSWMLQTKIK